MRNHLPQPDRPLQTGTSTVPPRPQQLLYPEQLAARESTQGLTPSQPPYPAAGTAISSLALQQARKKRNATWIAWALIALFAVIAVPLGGLAAFILAASPAQLLRDRLVERVANRTGRKLEISRVSFVATPAPGVLFSGITLAAPPAMGAQPAFRAARLQLTLALLPMLEGRVQVSSAHLVKPQFRLHTDRDGRRSWDFASLIGDSPPQRAAQQGESPSARNARLARASLLPRSRKARVSDRLPGRVLVTGGTIDYTDDRNGARTLLSGLDLTAEMPARPGAVILSGSMRWRGETVRLAARLAAPESLLARAASRLAVTLTAKHANASFMGTLDTASGLRLMGETRFSTARLQDLLLWGGVYAPLAGTINQMSANGRVDVAGNGLKLSQADIALGPTRIRGDIAIAAATGAQPRIGADLTIAGLDTGRLGAILSDARGAPPPASIDDLINRAGRTPAGAGRFSPQVRSYRSDNGWSTDPIDFSVLTRADMNARIAFTDLKTSRLTITQAMTRLVIASGSARLDIDDAALYGGRGQAVLTVTQTPAGPSIGINAAFDGIDAQSFLKDLADLEVMAGKAKVSAALTGTGASEKALLSTLAGKAAIAVRRGALLGWSIPAIAQEFESGRIPEMKPVPGEKTDFDVLSASFEFADGAATTQNLKLTSRIVAMDGASKADIGRRQLDMLLKPKLVDGGLTRGTARYLAGIAIPVRVKGDWRRPKLSIEPGRNWRDPAKRRRTARTLRERLKGRRPEDVIKGILRDGGRNEDVRAARRALKELFR